MKFLSLDWFKSEKIKQLEEENKKLKDENFKLAEDLEELETIKTEMVAINEKIEELKPAVKPYKSIFYVNNHLTVVLESGTVLGANVDNNIYQQVLLASTEEEILQLIYPISVATSNDEKISELQETKEIIENFSVLEESGDFTVVDGSVYMNNINRSLPKLLAKKFQDILIKMEEANDGDFDSLFTEYESLMKFWMKCCLNPNAKSAEDLYIFLSNHQFKIDRHGNFYAYRRVVTENESNKELVDFVSNTYNKVKAVWKKSPKNFNVYNNGGFTIVDITKQNHGKNGFVGNLQELYLDLPNMQEKTYTDNHTRSFDYKVGTVITMPRNEGDDDNTVSCSKGFHAASKAYDYSGFGDTDILMIINPMDVLAVPVGEVGKLRTCRWFFACTLDKNEQYILDEEDFDVTELGDIFEEQMSENLEEKVKIGFAEEVKRHTFQLPQISAKEVSVIINSLDDLKQELFNRVKNI